MFISKGEDTYIEYLVNVLFFQIRPSHNTAIKVNFSLESHFTQPHVSGLHVVDGPAQNKIQPVRESPGHAGYICKDQKWMLHIDVTKEPG